MEQNTDAWDLWCAANTQWRAGGFGLVGLDYPAMCQVAGLLEIPFTRDLLRKIQALEIETLKRQGKEEGKPGDRDQAGHKRH